MWQLLTAFLREYRERGTAASDAAFFYGDMQYFCIVFFVFWFFISFEFARKMQPVREVIRVMGKRSVIPFLHQLLVLASMIFLFAANVAVYGIVAYSRMDFPPAIVEQSVRLILYNIFLLSCASAGMGILVSCIPRKMVGYGVFLLLIASMVPDYYEMLQQAFPQSGWFQTLLQRAYGVWCFLPPDVSCLPDGLYGFSFESYRLAAMIFWIVAGCAVWMGACFATEKKKKRLVAGTYAGVLAVLFLTAFGRESVLRQNDAIWNAELYAIQQDENPAQRVGADFHIKKYVIDFSVGRKLAAKCRMQLEGSPAGNRYAFTLDRGYRVEDVRDGAGNPLPFTQEGDVVTVRADAAEDSVEMTYSGYSNLFYSNSNACFLPGFFPYYPRAGVREIMSEDHIFHGDEEEKAYFDVSVSGDDGYVVNLAPRDGRYRGTAESLTIVNGHYEEMDEDGRRYIFYPMEKSSYDVMNRIKSGDMKKQVEKLLNFLGASGDDGAKNLLDVPLIIAIPDSTLFNSLLKGPYLSDSCLLIGVQSGSPYQLLEKYYGGENPGDLQKTFFLMAPDADFNPDEEEYYRDLFGEEACGPAERLHDLVLDKMKEAGVKKTAQAIFSHITAENYQPNLDADIQFVQEIKKG